MKLDTFKKQPILGILRGVELDSIEPLFDSIITAGLKTVEITMNTKDASNLIVKAKKVCLAKHFI